MFRLAILRQLHSPPVPVLHISPFRHWIVSWYMRISVYDLSYTALPHTFRMASLYGHHTNAHVTGCQQWHYQKLPLLITAFIAGWLSHWGLRQWPCNAILPTHATFITNQLFYNFSSDIQETVLVHSGILHVADRSATSNLPQCPAARTRHICHADKSARFVRCATISSYLIYVTIYL